MTREERINLVSDAISKAEMNTTCIQALAFCGVVDGEINLESLAVYCDVTKGGMSRACEILEDRKLITRRRAEYDKRCLSIKITSKGQNLLTEMVTLEKWDEE
jgi:DNA-binding MarR family transcriptional regulator